jgi:hypothetical protein
VIPQEPTHEIPLNKNPALHVQLYPTAGATRSVHVALVSPLSLQGCDVHETAALEQIPEQQSESAAHGVPVVPQASVVLVVVDVVPIVVVVTVGFVVVVVVGAPICAGAQRSWAALGVRV